MAISSQHSPELNTEVPSVGAGGASPLRFLWLIGLFFVGFVLIVGLNKLFSDLIDELREQSANEQARLFIGEEIVRNIQDIEMDILRMTITAGPLPQDRIESELLKKVAKLEHDLVVLRDGGTVQQLIYLNIEGVEQTVREVAFKPDVRAKGYVMELAGKGVRDGAYRTGAPSRSSQGQGPRIEGLVKTARRVSGTARRRKLDDDVQGYSGFLQAPPLLFFQI